MFACSFSTTVSCWDAVVVSLPVTVSSGGRIDDTFDAMVMSGAVAGAEGGAATVCVAVAADADVVTCAVAAAVLVAVVVAT